MASNNKDVLSILLKSYNHLFDKNSPTKINNVFRIKLEISYEGWSRISFK